MKLSIHLPGRCCRSAEGCLGKVEYFGVYSDSESQIHLRCKWCYEREDTGFTKVGSVELLHLYLLR